MTANRNSHRFPGISRIGIRQVFCGLAALTFSGFVVEAPSATAQDAAGFEYTGDGRCRQCHNETLAEGDGLDREFSALDESLTFKHDKHNLAWKVLRGETAQRMQAILKSHRKDGYRVETAQECLSCHSGWSKNDGETPPRVYESGVTCESCHGAASEWWKEHLEVEWRLVDPQVKSSKYNFVDVRNPIHRAEQCFSCHIGNAKEGKIVTHEMYAAGHPPLPGIEIESFIADMPAHWRVLREKGQFKHYDKYLKANFPGMGYDPLEDLPRTKAVMVGGVMALHEAIELLADQSTVTDASGEPAWPELAVFDCTACHHDLRSPSWRQTRGYSGLIPGRPGTFEWPNALIKLAINHRAGSDSEKFSAEWTAFAEKKQELTAALNAQPFGSPEGLQKAASSILPWLKALASDVAMSPVQEPQAQHAIKQLLSLGPQDYPDYHSARQILWAYRTISSELKTPYPDLKKPPTDEQFQAARKRGYDNLLAFISWQKGPQLQGRQKVEDLLKKLEVSETMRLNLPTRVDRKITESLPNNLEAIGSYDPDWFREKLQMLAAESK
jgi:hypothetical protein